MARYKNSLLWVLVALCVSVFFWFKKEPETIENTISLDLPENPPDIYITGMDLKRFNTQGNVIMTTTAETVAIYEQTGESFLTKPNVILNNTEVQAWQITAESAILYKNEDIDFITNVVLLQLNDSPATQVNTEFIKVTNQGDLVLTDEPVQIVKGKQSINAIGMEVKLDTIEPIIHLLSDVSFQYDPSN